MRSVCFLFSIFIFILSVMPCGDCGDCTAVESNIAYTPDHSNHDHETELCSPFCTCACCSNQTNVPQEFSMHFRTELTSNNQILNTVEDVSEVSLAIWQPPKLG